MKKIFFLLVTSFLVFNINAQQTAEFETTIYIMDLNGNTDSVIVGYDLNATDGIDTQFGEVELTAQPWDSTLEIRVSPYFTPDGDKLSKKQIISLDCNSEFAIYNVVVLNIKSKTAVNIFWTPQEFQENCRDSSVIVEDDFFFQYPYFPAYRESYMANRPNHGATFDITGYNYSYYQGNIEGGGTDTIRTIFIGFVDDMDKLSSTNKQKQLQQQTKTFPNPTRDKFTIQLPKNYTSESVQVFDITGRQIYQNTEQNNQLEVSSSDWAKGVYFYRVELEDGIFVNGKVVKQ